MSQKVAVITVASFIFWTTSVASLQLLANGTFVKPGPLSTNGLDELLERSGMGHVANIHQQRRDGNFGMPEGAGYRPGGGGYRPPSTNRSRTPAEASPAPFATTTRANRTREAQAGGAVDGSVRFPGGSTRPDFLQSTIKQFKWKLSSCSNLTMEQYSDCIREKIKKYKAWRASNKVQPQLPGLSSLPGYVLSTNPACRTGLEDVYGRCQPEAHPLEGSTATPLTIDVLHTHLNDGVGFISQHIPQFDKYIYVVGVLLIAGLLVCSPFCCHRYFAAIRNCFRGIVSCFSFCCQPPDAARGRPRPQEMQPLRMDGP